MGWYMALNYMFGYHIVFILLAFISIRFIKRNPWRLFWIGFCIQLLGNLINGIGILAFLYFGIVAVLMGGILYLEAGAPKRA